MKTIRNLFKTKKPLRRAVVTIGAFDGIHTGHRKILGEVVLLARGLGARGVVVTFEPHPMTVIQPGESPCLLTTARERAELMAELGLDEIAVMRFSSKLAARSAEWFVRNILLARLNMKRLVIGYDFRFGRGREGDASYLKSLGEKHGFGVDIVPPVRYLGHPVSSTRVRTALVRGDVRSAATMLGRPYSVSGRVARGEGRGRRLTYPTANLGIDDNRKILPSRGIYAGWVRASTWVKPAAVYVGTKPTFGGRSEAVEVHVLDMKGNLYGRRLEVSFVRRLRDDRVFDGEAALKRAIARDVARARKILTT